MNPAILLLIVGFAFVVVFGGLSLLRREGLSMRLAVEAVVFTALASGLVALTGSSFHPVLFLLLLYLLTMRVRLLVDLGNFFAKRGQYRRADQLYTLASRLWPDQSGRLILLINQATALLQQNNLDTAIAMFSHVLQQSEKGYLGVKYEAAAHYNLGVAYQRKNMAARAVVEFNAVLEAWPASEFSRRAEAALEKRRRKNNSSADKR